MALGYASARAAYKDNSVSTASPARAVVLAYERMMIDCERAVACLDAELHAGKHLIDAQGLVLALQSNLDCEVWDCAHRLSGPNTYLYQELVSANMTKSITKVWSWINLITPILESWRHAVGVVTSQSQLFAVSFAA